MHFVVPGLGFLGSQFSDLEKTLALAKKPKKSTPMQLKIQQEFLKDQRKVKDAEQDWFDKLEIELERMEMDDHIRGFEAQSSEASQTALEDSKLGDAETELDVKIDADDNLEVKIEDHTLGTFDKVEDITGRPNAIEVVSNDY